MNSGLIPFMTARLDEDEAAGKLAARAGGTWKQDDPDRRPGAISSPGGPVVYDGGSPDEHQAAHIVRHDPARVLREVEAKRARLALFEWALTEMDRLLADDDADKVDQAAAVGCCEAARTGVKLDAAVYSEHKDYRQEWKP